jgi:hypothetical protein
MQVARNLVIVKSTIRPTFVKILKLMFIKDSCIYWTQKPLSSLDQSCRCSCVYTARLHASNNWRLPVTWRVYIVLQNTCLYITCGQHIYIYIYIYSLCLRLHCRKGLRWALNPACMVHAGFGRFVLQYASFILQCSRQIYDWRHCECGHNTMATKTQYYTRKCVIKWTASVLNRSTRREDVTRHWHLIWSPILKFFWPRQSRHVDACVQYRKATVYSV